MKYFVLYVDSEECYLKGKSFEHMEDRIQTYSHGILSTNKWTIITSNTDYGYLREVSLSEYPQLTKRDFATINENNSFSYDEINTIK